MKRVDLGVGRCSPAVARYAMLGCVLFGAAGWSCNQRSDSARPAPAQGAQPPAAEQGLSAEVATQGPALVFLGDSLTAGLGLEQDETIPHLIQQRLRGAAKPYTVINAGRSGDTTAGGLARVDWYLRDNIDVRLVVIGLGSNDAMRGLPLSAMESNLRAIIQRVKERKPKSKILLWELETFPNLGADYGSGFAQLFQRVAESERIELIDFPLAGVAGKPEFNQADGIHPNPAGAEKIAALIWTAVQPHL